MATSQGRRTLNSIAGGLLVLLFGWYGWHQLTGAPKQATAPAQTEARPADAAPAEKRSPIVAAVLADELIAAYGENELAADATYTGKRLLILGAVREVKKDIMGEAVMWFGKPLRGLGCRLAPEGNELVMQARRGMQVAMTGTSQGASIGQVLLKDCVIDDVAAFKQREPAKFARYRRRYTDE